MNWAMRRSVERQAIRMHQMMNRLHVDALALVRLRNGAAYAQARSRCLQCEDVGACLHWLDKGGPIARPDFCPNLALFDVYKTASLFGAALPIVFLARSRSQG